MDGFEAGERYRNQQQTLLLDESPEQKDSAPCVMYDDQHDQCGTFGIPCEQDPKKGCHLSESRRNRIIDRPALPVRIHFMKGNYGEHLYFLCQDYRPYGANPEYHKDRKYRGNSGMCDRCFKIIDGVPYKAPFHCVKYGGSHRVYHPLFNWNPLDHVDPHLRREISAGMKLLTPQEKRRKS